MLRWRLQVYLQLTSRHYEIQHQSSNQISLSYTVDWVRKEPSCIQHLEWERMFLTPLF